MLIVKSPYLKCDGKEKVSGYMKYIATRDRVEKLPQSDVYMQYIATRPGSEQLGEHGLFGDEDYVDLEKSMTELDNYIGKVWTHIFSLKREDAQRLGIDNAKSWRDLIRCHRNEIAKAMNIPADNFRWKASFHNESHHPHVHMMAWSSKSNEGYLTREGINSIRSELTNDIFQNEMLHVYEQKSQSRDDLNRETRKQLIELISEMKSNICSNSQIEELLFDLSQKLENLNGKKKYGYLPKSIKSIVNEIVDEIEQMPVVAESFKKWKDLQFQVQSYYTDEKQKKLKLSEQKEFKSIKNIIIQEAEKLGEMTFEDKEVEFEPDEKNASYYYLKMKYIAENEDYSIEDRDNAIEELETMANNGDMYAQYFVGLMERNGLSGIPNDDEAIRRFTQSAENGHAVAMYELGKMYVDIDKEKSVCWLNLAFERGNHYAGYLIGKELLKENDNTKAVEYFQKSAEDGNQYSQYMLGKIYLQGEIVEQDIDFAKHCFAVSASNGNDYAQLYLDRLEENNKIHAVTSVINLIHSLANVFQENSLPQKSTRDKISSKRLKEIFEKKRALGLKPEISNEYRGMSY